MNIAGSASIHPTAALLRGFAVDFLTGHDLGVPARIMAPDYRLTIGGHVLDGRDDAYLPATATQLERFPGLCVTVHDIVITDEAAAFDFTEHGASLRHDGQTCSWDGVAVFRVRDGRLACCWAEEDYFSRRQQLSTGRCGRLRPPHVAPWDTTPADGDPGAEDAARAWLTRGEPVATMGIDESKDSTGPGPGDLIWVSETVINELFSAGTRVAFHVTQRGAYAGGFDDIAESVAGSPVLLHAAGLLTVQNRKVVAARVTSDRLGLYFSLQQSPDASAR